MSTTWYDTIATLGWLAGVTTTDPPALPHLRPRAAPPAPGGQGVRHPRRALRRAGHLRGRRRSRDRGVRRDGPGLRPPRPGHRRGHRRRWPPASTDEFPSSPVRGGRHRASGSSPGRCSRRGRRSGSAAPRRPRCGAPPATRTAGCPSRSGPTPSCSASLRTLRDEYRDGAPLDIGGDRRLPPRRARRRPVSSSRGAPSPVRRTASPSTCSASPTPGSVRSRCASRRERRRRALRPDRRVRERGRSPGGPAGVNRRRGLVAAGLAAVVVAGMLWADAVTLQRANRASTTRSGTSPVSSTTMHRWRDDDHVAAIDEPATARRSHPAGNRLPYVPDAPSAA